MKTFEITGAVYDTDPMFYEWDKEHEFPHYRQIATVPMGTRDFATLTDAMNWFVQNYPSLYKGGCIREIGGAGDFCCFAVPGAAYGEEG